MKSYMFDWKKYIFFWFPMSVFTGLTSVSGNLIWVFFVFFAWWTMHLYTHSLNYELTVQLKKKKFSDFYFLYVSLYRVNICFSGLNVSLFFSWTRSNTMMYLSTESKNLRPWKCTKLQFSKLSNPIPPVCSGLALT